MPTFLILLALLLLSLYFRILNKRRTDSHDVPENVKPSPLSEALQELIAHAGAIYLSLVLLASFLHIELADKWNVYGVEMEPLAFMALILAFIQPLVLKLYRSVKGS